MTDENKNEEKHEVMDQEELPNTPAQRIRNGLIITFFGFALFILGARPGVFFLDRSPVVGFVQIAVFLIGLGIMCTGGYTSIMTVWREEGTSIAADIGSRMVATGFVVCIFSGMADVFGFGSHPLPGVPFFGGVQAIGVVVGEVIISIGFLLMIPFPKFSKK